MSKIYQELEQIFKFRILKNDDIPAYLKKMTAMGKMDDVKKSALYSLILTRLGELEDQEVALQEEKLFVPPMATLGTFTCDVCGKEAKSAFGLQSHKRSHKTKE